MAGAASGRAGLFWRVRARELRGRSFPASPTAESGPPLWVPRRNGGQLLGDRPPRSLDRLDDRAAVVRRDGEVALPAGGGPEDGDHVPRDEPTRQGALSTVARRVRVHGANQIG